MPTPQPTPQPTPSQELPPPASHVFPAPPLDPPSAPASPSPPHQRQRLEYVCPPVGRPRGAWEGGGYAPVNEHSLDEMLIQVSASREKLYEDAASARRDLGELLYRVDSLTAQLCDERKETDKFMKKVADIGGEEMAEWLLYTARAGSLETSSSSSSSSQSSARKRSRGGSSSESEEADEAAPPKKRRTPDELTSPEHVDTEFVQGGSGLRSPNPDRALSAPLHDNPTDAAPASPHSSTASDPAPNHANADGERWLALTKRPPKAQLSPKNDGHPAPLQITFPDPFNLRGPSRSTDKRISRPRGTRAPVTRARERLRTDPVSGEPVAYHYEETPEYKERMRLNAEWERERAAEKAREEE